MLPVSQLVQNRPAPYLMDAAFSTMEAARFLRKHRIGGAPVVRDGRLVGFCSERDIVFRVVAEQRDPMATRVADIMSVNLHTADISARVEECERRMRAAHVRHLPILDQGKVVACLSLRDLLQSEPELKQAVLEVQCLEDYVRTANG
jgi:CBS domain-containing protein